MLECKDGKNNKYAIDIVRGRQNHQKLLIKQDIIKQLY